MVIKRKRGRAGSDIRGGEERTAPGVMATPSIRGWGKQLRSLSAACSSDNPCTHLAFAPAPEPLPRRLATLSAKTLVATLPHCQLLFLASLSFLPARAEGKQLPPEELPPTLEAGAVCGGGKELWRQAGQTLSPVWRTRSRAAM